MPRTYRWTWLGALALATCPTLALGQEAATQNHTVRAGDTLWDLARQYKGDPFLWPDLYRLNTSVVEDPHWIYPGEVLRLASGGVAVASVPSVDTPVAATAPAATDSAADGAGGAASAEAAPAEPATSAPAEVAEAEPASLRSLTQAHEDEGMPRLFGPRRGDTIGETLRANVMQPPRPLRESEFYSSGFLTEHAKLPFGEVLGPVTPPQIDAEARNTNAMPYATIAVQAPKGATYQVGDTLLIASIGPELRPRGDVVMPTGLARVTGASQGNYLALVMAVYGPIRRGQKVLPAEKFVPATATSPVPVTDGVHATLLGGPKRQELKTPQMVVFLDKGRQDGVMPGDMFEIRRQAERFTDGTMLVDELMATLQVVHVREHSATARMLRIVSPDIAPGSSARQVAKLP